MSTHTLVAGYPVHRVAKFRRWENPYGVRFTEWAAACGYRGNRGGHNGFGTAGSAREAELCRQCFPNGHEGTWPAPVEADEL